MTAAAARKVLQQTAAAELPTLRAAPLPPARHADLTLLLYCFPETPAFDLFEYALRKSLQVLGALPAVLVVPEALDLPATLTAVPGLTVQREAALRPGSIDSMSLDCITRLHTRFTTSRVLIIQDDGRPLRDDLARFLPYDFTGAPDVRPGWRARLADALGLTVLNGGFSLRSRALCAAAAELWANHPLRKIPAEDRFYARLRKRFRFAPAGIARTFSQDTLAGALPFVPEADPMGFHRAETYAAHLAPLPHLTVVSVVRDRGCWERCIGTNPHLAGATLRLIDNTQENRPVPERYNAFLDGLPEATGWILFAHEDLELREDPRPLLRGCDPLTPYGLIGTRLAAGCAVLPFGRLSDSDRDGARFHRNRPPLPYDRLLKPEVENFDCCGFFVHADLFRELGLRFDPVCAWDLYAEDLAFQFICKTGRRARILPVKAHHFSRGNPDRDSFRKALAHLNAKYPDRTFAGGTCVFTVGKAPNRRLRLFRLAARLIRR